MNSPTIIPNLYCSWYISGGPSQHVVQIGKPPQISQSTSIFFANHGMKLVDVKKHVCPVCNK